MKNQKYVAASSENTKFSETVASYTRNGGNWTTSINGKSGDVKVTVNSLSDLFSRSKQLSSVKKRV